MKQSKYCIEAAARSSPLSRAQVQEVERIFPEVEFQVTWIDSMGDKDKGTSLRTLGKSDFFTRELDELVLDKKVRIAIHSAKDLPEKMPLHLACLTECIDPRDCLVGELKEYMLVATSSVRREEAVRQLVPTARFVDLRGTIEERLSRLGEVDGVVIAAAALIRLKLDENFVYLPGPTVFGQGRLAIVCREEDEEARTLFGARSARA